MLSKRSFFLSILLLLVFSKEALTSSYNYRFTWLGITVSSLSITYKEPIFHHGGLNFKIETQGPLKLYRNYSSSGYVKEIDENRWDYYLTGLDRGQPEEKKISYFRNKAPKIIKFIDDKGEKPLEIDQSGDIGSLDPFSVILFIASNIKKNEDYADIFHIMHGKRRYVVEAHQINEKDKATNTEGINKKLIPYRIFVYENNPNNKVIKFNKWPFNGKEKYFDIWFIRNKTNEVFPYKFRINSPIGRIMGRLEV